MRFTTRIVLILAVAVGGSLLTAAGSFAQEERELLFQRIAFDSEKAKWVGVGNGPFTDMFPDGVAPDDPGLSGNRLSAEMFRERAFGSIGAAKGGVFPNHTGRAVGDIHITLLNGDTFADTSRDGDDFVVTVGTDDQNRATLTLTAVEGKELKPGDIIWMKFPEGPQPFPGQDPAVYMGKLTPFEAPEPSKQEELPPKVESDDDLGIRFDSTTGTLTFSSAQIVLATYLDGTTVSSPATDPIIGSLIEIGSMQLLGLSTDVFGAYRFSDSALRVTNGSEFILAATLADPLLFADSVTPGFDTILQATLVWEEGNLSLGSRYLFEHFNLAAAAGFSLHSNLLSLTSNLAHSGESNAFGEIHSTQSVPEVPAWIMLCCGLLAYWLVSRQGKLQRS